MHDNPAGAAGNQPIGFQYSIGIFYRDAADGQILCKLAGGRQARLGRQAEAGAQECRDLYKVQPPQRR
jgi:hypothetical protein